MKKPRSHFVQVKRLVIPAAFRKIGGVKRFLPLLGLLLWVVALVYLAASIAIATLSVATSFIVPFSSLVISLGLPAVYAMIVPNLVTFRVEPAPSLPPT